MKKIGITALRVCIGLLFVGHGLQKLKGWFGGAGLDKTAEGFDRMGIQPARQQALLAGATETTAGTLLLTGFLTPVASSMVSGVMTEAIRHVHAKNGPWVTKGGYEYNAVLMASVFTITAEGPGPLSLDRRFGIERHGAGVAIAQLLAGVGAAATVELVSWRAAMAPRESAPAAEGQGPQAMPADTRTGRDTTATGRAASFSRSSQRAHEPITIDLRSHADAAEDGPIIPNPSFLPGEPD